MYSRFPELRQATQRRQVKVDTCRFDFRNSPHEMLTAPVEGKTLIHSTPAGAVGAYAAVEAHLI